MISNRIRLKNKMSYVDTNSLSVCRLTFCRIFQTFWQKPTGTRFRAPSRRLLRSHWPCLESLATGMLSGISRDSMDGSLYLQTARTTKHDKKLCLFWQNSITTRQKLGVQYWQVRRSVRNIRNLYPRFNVFYFQRMRSHALRGR